MVSPVGAIGAPNIFQFSGTRNAQSADGAARVQGTSPPIVRPVQPTVAISPSGDVERPEFRRPQERRSDDRPAPVAYTASGSLPFVDLPTGRLESERVPGRDPYAGRSVGGRDGQTRDPFEDRRAARSEGEVDLLGRPKPRVVDDGSSAAREAALRKLRAYEAEKASRFNDEDLASNPRKALAALREDLLFFGSLNPIEQTVPEVARALRSAAVIVPLQELSNSGKAAEQAELSASNKLTAEEAKRNPLAELADRLLDELTPAGQKRAREGAREVEAALERTAVRLLGLAAEDPELRQAFSPESLQAIEQRTKELNKAPAPARNQAPLFSIVA